MKKQFEKVLAPMFVAEDRTPDVSNQKFAEIVMAEVMKAGAVPVIVYNDDRQWYFKVQDGRVIEVSIWLAIGLFDMLKQHNRATTRGATVLGHAIMTAAKSYTFFTALAECIKHECS